MFSIKQPSLRHVPADEVIRGNVISIDGNPRSAAIVESCEEQGANVVVKIIGESPVILSKDRRVSVYSYSL
ncbi:hypothetical protein GCM10007938_26800 [Vibrio zhanjiangensis]|uniref:Uncharacterized protein n=1 Tax=Vibrio zhanjiangensis TaxID=1046128 RepID=A0ABQ6F086_9VIBR|nr:hypothetical protein [Vibrio zhanjiangensis]GLT18898.1 hypothetical protein GCM10007938_26800 [Vibrio zhanjiangensis]